MKRATQASTSRCTLILIRHGHTHMAGTFCGLIDPPLSQQGLAQLPALNEKLKSYPITHIFSSDLRRARQTAESIARPRGLQVHFETSLHELAFGSWEGLNWDEVMARDPEYAQRWLDSHPSVPAPGGECFEDFLLRIQRGLEDIATRHSGACVAVVTHAGVIRTFLGDVARKSGVSYDLAQCGYTSCWEVWHEEGKWRLPQAASPVESQAGTERSARIEVAS
jgi:broad specificity phosphatase PhoE